MLRLYPIVGTLTLVATAVGRPPTAAAAPPTTVTSVSQLVCPEPSERGQPATPGARPNDELMAGETFQRAMTDVLRLGIAVRFCELRPDTLTLDRMIESRLRQVSPMREIASVRTTSANVFKKPISISAAGTGWVAETGQRDQTTTPTLALTA